MYTNRPFRTTSLENTGGNSAISTNEGYTQYMYSLDDENCKVYMKQRQ